MIVESGNAVRLLAAQVTLSVQAAYRPGVYVLRSYTGEAFLHRLDREIVRLESRLDSSLGEFLNVRACILFWRKRHGVHDACVSVESIPHFGFLRGQRR